MEEQYFGSAHRPGKPYNRLEEKTKPKTVFGMQEDFMENKVDLNEQLINNMPATFFFRMKGDAMRDAGIFDNDLLIVDRSVKLSNGRIVVAILNGELLVRRFHKNFTSAFLLPENSSYKPVIIGEFSEFVLYGIVMHAIHSYR